MAAIKRKSRFRILLRGTTFLSISLLLGGITIDKWAGRCELNNRIVESIREVDSRTLERNVRELSAIGSRFVRVKKGSGIRTDPSESEIRRTINRNLNPFGMALSTDDEQAKKIKYIKSALRDLGLQPREHPFKTSKVGHGMNLFAYSFDPDPSEEILDVTCHYDTFAGSPGADDNNSGVAGVLEIARIVRKENRPTHRNVRFIFFDLEELGLLGSRAFVGDMKAGKIAESQACLNLEMIGYFTNEPESQKTPVRIPFIFDPPRVGNTIVPVGNLRSYWHARKLEGALQAYVPDLPVFSLSRWGDLLKNASRSDHSSYWEAGIPAAMLTDTANFRNPNYHKPSDLPGTIDLPEMTKVVQGASAFVLEWLRD